MSSVFTSTNPHPQDEVLDPDPETWILHVQLRIRFITTIYFPQTSFAAHEYLYDRLYPTDALLAP
jgi:hypothetical protein